MKKMFLIMNDNIINKLSEQTHGFNKFQAAFLATQ